MPTTRTAGFALIAATGMSTVCFVWAAFAQPAVALRGLLCAWLFFAGLSLGASTILLAHALTGGEWIASVRRYLIAATRVLPVLSILLVPMIIGSRWLFPWASSPHDDPLRHFGLDSYLRTSSFAIRMAIYVLVWNVIAARARATKQPGRGATAAALFVQTLTVSLAAVDLVASREPHWSSSVLGLIVIVGQMLGALAFVTYCAARDSWAVDRREGTYASANGGDLGNLLLTFVLTWAYLAFMQFLIIWAEDLPRETSWYIHRMQDGWLALGVAVTLLQFVLPFALLLSRALKRSATGLGAVAALLIFANWLYCVWLTGPALGDRRPLHGLDFIAAAAIGGAWIYGVLLDLRIEPNTPLVGLTTRRGG